MESSFLRYRRVSAQVVLKPQELRSPCCWYTRYYSRQVNVYYEILGVSTTATDKEIRAAYFRLCKQFHPDANSSGGRNSNAKFIEINEAYRVLSKPDLRQRYDEAQHIRAEAQQSINQHRAETAYRTHSAYVQWSSASHQAESDMNRRWQAFYDEQTKRQSEKVDWDSVDIKFFGVKVKKVYVPFLIFICALFVSAISVYVRLKMVTVNSAINMVERSRKRALKHTADDTTLSEEALKTHILRYLNEEERRKNNPNLQKPA